MRVNPRPWIGVLVLLGYVAIVAVVGRLSGVPFDDIASSADNIFKSVIPSFIAGGTYLVIATSLLGWWRPALREERRSPRRWPVLAPVLMVVVALTSFAQTDWSLFDARFLLALLLLGIGVGFCEELVSRGVLIVGLRARYREGLVWFLSSLLFGCMHLANLVTGSPISNVVPQVLVAFASGTSFYILRRVTGSLVWAMALHGVWDISVFMLQFTEADVPIAGLATPVVSIVSLAVVAWVIRGSGDTRPTEAATFDERSRATS